MTDLDEAKELLSHQPATRLFFGGPKRDSTGYESRPL